jgi:mannose-6-phosphate isomerase
VEENRGMRTEERRPWGGFLILEERSTHKLKRIWIHAGHRLSYQKHLKRSEHWVIVEGKAKVILDGREMLLEPGDCIHIPQGLAHRIGNIGENILTFIEIQRGDDFSEDDVIRLEDDYGRADESLRVNVHE